MCNLLTRKVLYTLAGGLMFAVPLRPAVAQAVNTPQQTNLTYVWVDRSGHVKPVGTPPRAYTLMKLSPDGQRIATDVGGLGRDEWNVWIYDIPTSSLKKFTELGNNRYPVWTPDGKRIAYSSDRNGQWDVYWKAADGSGAEEKLVAGGHAGPQGFSPDGSALCYYEVDHDTNRDIWVLPLTGNRKPRAYLRTPKIEGGVVFSPDSRWLAYVSNDTGRFEVYVQPFPGPGARVQVSFEGGTEPLWPRNSRELFYRHDDQRMAVEMTTQPALVVGKPKVLFEGSYERGLGTRANWDATSDGQRFLLLQAVK